MIKKVYVRAVPSILKFESKFLENWKFQMDENIDWPDFQFDPLVWRQTDEDRTMAKKIILLRKIVWPFQNNIFVFSTF